MLPEREADPSSQMPYDQYQTLQQNRIRGVSKFNQQLRSACYVKNMMRRMHRTP